MRSSDKIVRVGIPSFKQLQPASEAASAAARGSSRKFDTKCEIVLRRALRAAGLRYRKDDVSLLGRPDVVFRGPRVVVFCDGDFWHGRNWDARKRKLSQGHNAPYWLAKIERNMARDQATTDSLEDAGWTVLRFWETDILRDVDSVTKQILATLALRRQSRATPRSTSSTG